MQRNQINLNEMPVKKNKEFLKALYQTKDLERARKWFDKLDCSVSFARREDSDMTLEAFLGLMNKSFHFALQVGSPHPEEIRYGACSLAEEVDKFAWVECAYNEHNYGVISCLFEQAYGKKMDSIPVPEHLKEYHKQLERKN